MEIGEIRQRRFLFAQFTQGVDVRLLVHQYETRVALLQLFGDAQQHFGEVGRRSTRGADVGHEQHRVATGLVDLDRCLSIKNLFLKVSPSMPVLPVKRG